MNRKNFIRSFIILCAIPSIIADLNETKNKKKISFYTKFSNEIINDEKYIEDLFFNDNSTFRQDLLRKGFDFNKPYKVAVGWENDDFSKNLKTVMISQYV